MSYLKGYHLDKAAILRDLKEKHKHEAYKHEALEQLALDQENYDYLKLGTIDSFAYKLLEKIKEATPFDPDHFKRYKLYKDSEGKTTGLPHLRDSISLSIFNEGYALITTSQPYAAIVHEDFTARHDGNTRAGYMHDVAIEESEALDNPFDIYYNLEAGKGESTISLLIINTLKINTKDNDRDLNTPKYRVKAMIDKEDYTNKEINYDVINDRQSIETYKRIVDSRIRRIRKGYRTGW